MKLIIPAIFTLGNMYKIVKLIGFIFVICLLQGCLAPKPNYFSYKVGTYVIDTAKHLLYSDNLISYGNHLFEFKTRVSISETIIGDSLRATSVSYDTIGVYLLSSITNKFYEFDTFSLKSNLLKVGRLEDKPFGQRISSNMNGASSSLSYAIPKKVLLNNISCFVSEVTSNDKNQNSSTRQHVVLIRDPQFNSLYKINNVKFSDSNYCIVGFQIYDIKQKQSFVQRIELLRPLTKSEQNICTEILEKAR